MRPLRLSGWQRLWVVASVLYAIPVIWLTYLQLGTIPGEAYEKRQWAVSAAELLAGYVDVPKHVTMEPLFGKPLSALSADEIFERIYSIPRAYRAQSASTNPARDANDIEQDCKQGVKDQARARLPEGGFIFTLFPEEEVDKCKLAVLRGMIEGGRLVELKNFSLEKFQAQLAELEADYKTQSEKARKDHFVIAGLAFLGWLLPTFAVYILGLAAGWVYRGFRNTG